MRRANQKKAQICLLSPGKSQISVPYTIIDAALFPFTILPSSTITHQHSILREKTIDIQTELSYIFPVRKQCLIKNIE
jgi:hypothetical protein